MTREQAIEAATQVVADWTHEDLDRLPRESATEVVDAVWVAARALATWGSGPDEPDGTDIDAATVVVDAVRQQIASDVRRWCDHIIVGQYHHTCSACEYIARRIQEER
jgi:hypothetical protein